MTGNRPATPSSQRRLILLAVAFLIGWAAGMALLGIGVVRSVQVTDAPHGAHLWVGVAVLLVGALGSVVISLSLTRGFRALPSPPHASRAERLQVLDDIKHGRISDNTTLEVALASRLRQGNQRLVALVAVLVLLLGLVILVPGPLQTIAVIVFALLVLVLCAASVPQTRQANEVLQQLPAAGAPDRGYQAKLAKQLKLMWLWTGAVFVLVAVVVLVVTLLGHLPVGVAVGAWIGLALLWTGGYLHSSWMARPK